MKKLIVLLLALGLLAGLAACNSQNPNTTTPPETTVTPESTDPPETSSSQTQPPENTDTEAFTFTLSDIPLVPGAAFDESKMPEAASVFQVPSCAIEGTDNVYNYTTVEVTVFDDGNTPVIYSIYLADPNTATDEGLYQGDDLAAVERLYGTEYTKNGSELVYQKGNTQLRIIVNNDIVTSIEYRMVTA